MKKTHSQKNINPHCFFYPSLNNTKISTHRELSRRREIHVYSFGISWKRKIRKKKNKNKVIFFFVILLHVCLYVCMSVGKKPTVMICENRMFLQPIAPPIKKKNDRNEFFSVLKIFFFKPTSYSRSSILYSNNILMSHNCCFLFLFF